MESLASDRDLTSGVLGSRKLIAVAHADMVGYSRLVGLDDIGTLRRLRALRRALIDPAIREHGGRIVQTAGDSLLVVFDSIDGAVRAAVAIQQNLPAYDEEQPPDRRIRFRVGIDIGDVIADGGELCGEGVNVAARLQAECPSGGVCISRAVHDHVSERLDLAFQALGNRGLKNIAHPVEAFVLRLDPPTAIRVKPARDSMGFVSNALARKRLTLAALVLLPLAIAGGLGWTLYDRGREMPHRVATLPDLSVAAAPPLSIVVLPFENLGDPSDDHLADAITDDLTTSLSRLSGSFVIARESAYTYKGKATDVKTVGGELGVRYVLEGSVRKLGSVLRVNTQLISTQTGAHVWADRFEENEADLFAGQDEIMQRLAVALNVELVQVEAARSLRERPINADAFDLILRARALETQTSSDQRRAVATALYERALQLDPSSVDAQLRLASNLLDRFLGIDLEPDDGMLDRAKTLLAEAAALQPDASGVLLLRAYLPRVLEDWPAAIAASERFIELNPNEEFGYNNLAVCKLRTGAAAEAIPLLDTSIRLNPRSPFINNRYQRMGYAMLQLGRDEEATVWLNRALAANPDASIYERQSMYRGLAASYALSGHLDDAHRAIAEANRLWPYATVRSVSPFDPSNPVVAAQFERFQQGLRLAGLRDHADEDADFHTPADDKLSDRFAGLTPMTAPGASTIRTPELVSFLSQQRPIVIDTALYSWGRSLPGAVGLRGVGVGGSLSGPLQGRLNAAMQGLTGSDRSRPIVAVGFNSERFDGRNLALRLVALGYSRVYWYRGGREAWETSGLPEVGLVLRDW